MGKSLHAAGIEGILDVVYNHTAEGNHLGPTLSFRGIDNAAYYRLVDDDKRYYMNYTGTGNSFNVRHPHSLQLIMDSLRYWVTEMHVDGFRFDLAAALAREFYDVDRLPTFFEHLLSGLRAHLDARALEADEALIEFTASVARLRRQHPTFRHRRLFDGRPVFPGAGEPLPDIVWMTPSGDVMTPGGLARRIRRSIGVFLNGNGIRGGDSRGARVVDDSFLLLFKAHDQTLEWTLPAEEYAPVWRLVIDTSGVPDQVESVQAGSTVQVVDKGMVVLQLWPRRRKKGGQARAH